MTTTRAHRLATMSTVASAFTAAVCSIFGDVLDAAPRARASARRESRKRRSSDTGSDTPAAVFFTPASRALARAAPCLAVIVLAALFTTARADGGRHLLQGEPVAAGRNAPTAGTVSAGRNAATSSSRTTTTSPRTITGDDTEGRTLFTTCTGPPLPCVEKCKKRLTKCLLPWKPGTDPTCGSIPAEECLARYVCCIDDECCEETGCDTGCIGKDEACPDTATGCECCAPLTCSGETEGICECPAPCITLAGPCVPDADCCCDGSYCSDNDNTCVAGSCETAMAKGSASVCFPKGSWGWAVQLVDTQVEAAIFAAAGNNCESTSQVQVGTASINDIGSEVTLKPAIGYTFEEVHIDVQCTQPTTRDAPGQYNWNDLAPDLDPCPASDTCTYLSVGSVSGTCLETCGGGPCWFRIHVKARDAT